MGGTGLNLRISGFERYLAVRHLMFLSREIDIKLCQNYTKKDICQILYKICSIKQIIFINYATNLKTTISHSNRTWNSQVCDYFKYYKYYVISSFFLYSPFKQLSFSANANNMKFNWRERSQIFVSCIASFLTFFRWN